jgi:hypothetical protein
MGGGVPLLGVYLTTQGVKLHALKGGAYGALAGQPERLLVDESAPRTDVGDDQGDTHGHDKHDHKNHFFLLPSCEAPRPKGRGFPER